MKRVFLIVLDSLVLSDFISGIRRPGSNTGAACFRSGF